MNIQQCIHKMRELGMDEHGRYPAFDHLGGYPLVYYMADGVVICPACANRENDSTARVGDSDPQWRLIGREVFYEGPELVCEHCYALIESAYGDPDERDEIEYLNELDDAGRGGDEDSGEEELE